MATEGSGFNPTAVLVHLVAIALGLYLGWIAMDRISPDLPDASVEPGVSATGEVAGDDAQSLFRPANLEPALTQLAGQMTPGEGLVRLHIEPGTLESELNSGDGLFQPTDVPADAPVVLTQTIDGPRWYVQLDTSRDVGPPPWTYGAPIAGGPIEVGPGPPKPVPE